MDVVAWLRSLGLGKYEAAFRENEITDKVLPNLTADDLKDLGVSIVGHRRRCDCCSTRPSEQHRGSSRAAVRCDTTGRGGCRTRWRAPTRHCDVLRSCWFDQHLCGA